MRKLITSLWIIALAVVVMAGPYNRKISVTGGSAQKLITVLESATYSGSATASELTICVPSSNVNTLYLGQSDVSATNGFPIDPGGCKTERDASGSPIDMTRIYLFVSSTESEVFSVRTR